MNSFIFSISTGIDWNFNSSGILVFCVSFMCMCLRKATLWADAWPVFKKSLTSTHPTTRRQPYWRGWKQEGSGLAVKSKCVSQNRRTRRLDADRGAPRQSCWAGGADGVRYVDYPGWFTSGLVRRAVSVQSRRHSCTTRAVVQASERC